MYGQSPVYVRPLLSVCSSPSHCMHIAIILHRSHAPCQGIIRLLRNARLHAELSCSLLCQATTARSGGDIGAVIRPALRDMKCRWPLLRGRAAGGSCETPSVCPIMRIARMSDGNGGWYQYAGGQSEWGLHDCMLTRLGGPLSNMRRACGERVWLPVCRRASHDKANIDCVRTILQHSRRG